MFEIDETVIIVPKSDLGDVTQIVSNERFMVKCREFDSNCEYPSFDLKKITYGLQTLPKSIDYDLKVKVVKNKSGEIRMFSRPHGHNLYDGRKFKKDFERDIKRFERSE